MVIQLQGVSIIKDSKYILKDVNWSVKQGEHWAILGLNGSGKTTLLNMINGYLFPSKGEVEVLGKTFGKYDLRKLRKSIGWVSYSLQEKLYGNESVEDIVISGKFATIGLYEESSEEDRMFARNLLERLDILGFSDRKYQSLSQGEKQRVLIARSLMPSPELLILDEPCTGLDIFAKEQLLSIIEKLGNEKNGPTLIYVTHHTDEILPNFKHALLLRRGQVHSSGETNSIFTEENLCDFFEASVILEKRQNRFSLYLSSNDNVR